MTLADTAGAVCAFLNLPPGTTTVTIESKTNFLGAVREGDVTRAARGRCTSARERSSSRPTSSTRPVGASRRTTQTQAVLHD